MMKFLKLTLGFTLFVFAVLCFLYVFNYETAKRNYEFKQSCDAQGGVIIEDEANGKYCFHRK